MPKIWAFFFFSFFTCVYVWRRERERDGKIELLGSLEVVEGVGVGVEWSGNGCDDDDKWLLILLLGWSWGTNKGRADPDDGNSGFWYWGLASWRRLLLRSFGIFAECWCWFSDSYCWFLQCFRLKSMERERVRGKTDKQGKKNEREREREKSEGELKRVFKLWCF